MQSDKASVDFAAASDGLRAAFEGFMESYLAFRVGGEPGAIDRLVWLTRDRKWLLQLAGEDEGRRYQQWLEDIVEGEISKTAGEGVE